MNDLFCRACGTMLSHRESEYCLSCEALGKPKPFYAPALEILQDLSREPVATIDELRQLQDQIEAVIDLIHRDKLIPMTELERHEHASRYGPGAFVIGDYVIRRR